MDLLQRDDLRRRPRPSLVHRRVRSFSEFLELDVVPAGSATGITTQLACQAHDSNVRRRAGGVGGQPRNAAHYADALRGHISSARILSPHQHLFQKSAGNLQDVWSEQALLGRRSAVDTHMMDIGLAPASVRD